jgi:glucokinase
MPSHLPPKGQLTGSPLTTDNSQLAMVLAIDLGGTKLATAAFSDDGTLSQREVVPLDGRKGREVGELIAGQVKKYIHASPPMAIGICVPGISRVATGTVWAPNIPGWDDYPLISEVEAVTGDIPVTMDSDRACCMFGELWKGNARGCRNAIYLAVGTGIGAGILIDGNILRGSRDIAGAVGWMALDKPFEEKYISCGCFEYYASGDGIAKFTRETLSATPAYQGELSAITRASISAHDVFHALEHGDPFAERIFGDVIQYWGMAAANLVSIFNPEKVIFGGGVFGPAARFISQIKEEASRWGQPVSMKQVTFEASALGGDAAIYGAARIALGKISTH